MKVTHLSGDFLSSSQSNNPQFMLTDRKGGFAFFSGTRNISRYNGLHISKGEDLYKTIDDIRLYGTEPLELLNDFRGWIRRCHGTSEKFNMQDGTLLYEVLGNGIISLCLDCRHIHDYDDRGRSYRIYPKDDTLFVEYTKKAGEDTVYRLCIAIKGAKSYTKVEQWEERLYDMDKARASFPWTRYVYNALRIPVDGKSFLSIGSGFTAEEAAAKADAAFRKAAATEKNIMERRAGMPDDVTLARACMKNALLDLTVEGENPGLYAGLPWFHQFWTRDEELCLKGLQLAGRKDLARTIFLRHIKSIKEDGRIPNRWPHSDLASADGIGLASVRASGIELSKEEAVFAENALRLSLHRLLDKHSLDGLMKNGPLETWMDTDCKDDTREGFRIEIQAYTLSMIRFLRLSKSGRLADSLATLEDAMKEHVREEFWKRPVLFDGKDDPTIRPNIFLAYYAYPDLLRKDEWKLAFRQALKQLWLDWGGLSSIDRTSHLFTETYTGENNRSYHRGDSWYFMNNLAALCLARVDRKEFKERIDRILEASTREILFMGIIGHHAEVSSALSQRSEGCLSQAWSAALYLELVEELFR